MPTPRKIYIKYHTESYLSQFILPNTLSLAFNKKLENAKRQEKQGLNRQRRHQNHVPEMTQILELSGKEYKIAD